MAFVEIEGVEVDVIFEKTFTDQLDLRTPTLEHGMLGDREVAVADVFGHERQENTAPGHVDHPPGKAVQQEKECGLPAVGDRDVRGGEIPSVFAFQESGERVAKGGITGRLVVVDEAPPRCSLATDIVSLVAGKAFASLKAPPVMVTPPHTPVPFARELESAYLP